MAGSELLLKGLFEKVLTVKLLLKGHFVKGLVVKGLLMLTLERFGGG